MNSEEKLWNLRSEKYLTDTIKNREWNNDSEFRNLFFKELGFKSPQELKNFIKENSISKKDSTDFNKSLVIQNKVNELINERYVLINSNLSLNEQKRFGFVSFILLLSVLFGLRYIYYLTKWCIKTLKE